MPHFQYSSLEPTVCHVLYVKDVEYTSAPPVAPTGHTARAKHQGSPPAQHHLTRPAPEEHAP